MHTVSAVWYTISVAAVYSAMFSTANDNAYIIVKLIAFWDVTPCNLIERYQCF